jgi:hypothetical protein
LDLYNTHFRKIDWERWEFSITQTWLSDGIYNLTGIVNWINLFTGSTLIDNNWPELEIKNIYTWNEFEPININITWWDNWIWIISWFYYSWTINNSNPSTWSSWFTWRIINTWIQIPAQNEPTTGTLIIQAKDSLWHITTKTTTIEWLNIAPTTYNLYKTWFEAENITFVASGYDPGSTTNT